MKKEKLDEPEKEQAILRIAVILLVFVYVGCLSFIGDRSLNNYDFLVDLGTAYLFISILLLFLVMFSSRLIVARRCFGMVIDIIMTTMCMYHLAEYGALFFSVYLWVIIGNGFRFGISYLVFCSLLSIAAFISLSYLSFFWSNSRPMIFSGLVMLTVLPAYVAVLLQRLTRQKEKAEAANREKTRFLANLNHEIRTPLNAIIGFSDKLKAAKDRDDVQRMIEHISNASGSLMKLVEGVLDFSRIEAGLVRLKTEPVDTRQLLYRLESMFSLPAADKGLDFIVHMDEALPRYFSGDEGRISQVLINLVANAVKFTVHGSVSVGARIVNTSTGEVLLFEVIDTGIGIPEEMHDRIFERFQQADDSVQRRYGGTGLGTAIARHLVEQMGGEIGMQSWPDKGSRFWFCLPLARTQPVLPENPVVEELRTLLQAIGPNPRLLVADDGKINRMVLDEYLNHDGVLVDHAESGDETLALLRRNVYDLLFLDIQMPGMSGFEVIEQYRQGLSGGPGVPIVVVTGEATREVQQECDRLGVAGLLLKPVDRERLRYTIAEIFPKGEGLPDPVPA